MQNAECKMKNPNKQFKIGSMRRVAGALALLIWPAIALGWSVEAELRIARKAATLAPPDLRLLIQKYEGDYLRGVREAAEAEIEGTHRERGARGQLRRHLERSLTTAIAGVRARQPMRDLVYQLGALSHFVADANNPLLNGTADLTGVELDYQSYFDRSLRRIPTVFYGLRTGFDPAGTLDAAFHRSRQFNALLHEEYYREGRRRASTEFDDRSTAFGIASISYSRAVSDTVNLYFHIWNQAGGDVRSAEILRKGNLLFNENVR